VLSPLFSRGVCWKKSELILNKNPTDCRAKLGRTKTERSDGQKGRGLGGKGNIACPRFPPPNFLPCSELALLRGVFALQKRPPEYKSVALVLHAHT